MRKLRSPGSVRGVPGDRHSYRDASTPSSDLVYACLTHVPMWFAYPDFVQTIHLGEAQGQGRINLKDLAPEWHEHHHVLGGSAGAFALKHYVIRDYPGAKQIAICQYRKFVSTRKIGVTVTTAFSPQWTWFPLKRSNHLRWRS